MPLLRDPDHRGAAVHERALVPHAYEDSEAPLHYRLFRALDADGKTRATLLIDAALCDEGKAFAFLDAVVEQLLEESRRDGLKLRLKLIPASAEASADHAVSRRPPLSGG